MPDVPAIELEQGLLGGILRWLSVEIVGHPLADRQR
jgi:hypothetical protein